MSSFDERGKGFESKFALDEELRFKAEARRNRLLGRWAAAKLGKTGDEAEAYAGEVIRSDFAEPGEEDVFRKVKADFESAGIRDADASIRQAMRELLAQAREQVVSER